MIRFRPNNVITDLYALVADEGVGPASAFTLAWALLQNEQRRPARLAS